MDQKYHLVQSKATSYVLLLLLLRNFFYQAYQNPKYCSLAILLFSYIYAAVLLHPAMLPKAPLFTYFENQPERWGLAISERERGRVTSWGRVQWKKGEEPSSKSVGPEHLGMEPSSERVECCNRNRTNQ